MTRIIRLFTNQPLSSKASVTLDKTQAHYLRNVLRRQEGDPISFFNGNDGEWLGRLQKISKTNGTVLLEKQIQAQKVPTDLWVLCAPVKKDRFDFCLEKTVELGASDFIPVYTEFTDIKRTNIERLNANAVEAAQQCGATYCINVHNAQSLVKILDQWPDDRILYACAEQGKADAFSDVLNKQNHDKAAILIGPEGGFSDQELQFLKNHSAVVFVHLGPLILRSETALTSAVTLYQSIKGNWVDYTRD